MAITLPSAGADVRVVFLDHCETDGLANGLIECVVYGNLIEANELFIAVESWSSEDDTHRSRTRFSIATSTIIEISTATWTKAASCDVG